MSVILTLVNNAAGLFAIHSGRLVLVSPIAQTGRYDIRVRATWPDGFQRERDFAIWAVAPGALEQRLGVASAPVAGAPVAGPSLTV